MQVSLEKNALYRAIGELAYGIARTDNMLSNLERTVFYEAVNEDLGEAGWPARDRYDYLLQKGQSLSAEQSYNRALYAFRQNKHVLSQELLEKFISLLEKVAGVSGISEDEILFIERFQADAEKILNDR